jgi:hypothetical protein
MKTESVENRIQRYLLGDLTEPEQFALEQQILGDGEAFEQVEAIEYDLIDSYVRGGLTASQKGLFEKNYLASAAHRERVGFARNLVRAANESKEGVASIAKPRSSMFWENRLSWAWAAMIFLIVAGGVWLYVENRQLRGQLNRLNQESSAVRQRSQELERDLNAEGEHIDSLAAELDHLREVQPPAVDPQRDQSVQRSLISFVLSPLLMRSGSEPQVVKLDKETQAVLLTMNVQERAERKFQVALRTVEGTQVLQRNSVSAHKQQKGTSAVSISIPANKLPAGDYILTLSAADGSGSLEEINRYFFRVGRN